MAQPVEQLTRNEQVVRSNRISSSRKDAPESWLAKPVFGGVCGINERTKTQAEAPCFPLNSIENRKTVAQMVAQSGAKKEGQPVFFRR